MSVRSSLTRTATIAVAIAALAAPTASARPADMPPAVAKAAAADQHKQNRRPHDTNVGAYTPGAIPAVTYPSGATAGGVYTPGAMAVDSASKATEQDRRSPDTRDAARATTPSDPNAARPDTAGNPNVSADAAHPAQTKDYSKNAATGDNATPAADAALAQERYYSSYGAPEPLAPPRSPVASDDTPWLPIAPSIAATLAIVAAGAAHLRRLRNRRGCADRATT
jgi:hypothetical protein